MNLPTREEAQALLEGHVQDEYQRYHAKMVATAMEGYAKQFAEPELLWYDTGLLHDLDYEKHPTVHPKESLGWFRELGVPAGAYSRGGGACLRIQRPRYSAGDKACRGAYGL